MIIGLTHTGSEGLNVQSAAADGSPVRVALKLPPASSARPVPLQSATRATSQTTQVKPEGRHSSATNQSVPIRVLQSREARPTVRSSIKPPAAEKSLATAQQIQRKVEVSTRSRDSATTSNRELASLRAALNSSAAARQKVLERERAAAANAPSQVDDSQVAAQTSSSSSSTGGNITSVVAAAAPIMHSEHVGAAPVSGNSEAHESARYRHATQNQTFLGARRLSGAPSQSNPATRCT